MKHIVTLIVEHNTRGRRNIVCRVIADTKLLAVEKAKALHPALRIVGWKTE